MPDDFDTMFAESTAEVEAGSGESAEVTKPNARIHKGDGEVIDPQADEGEADEEEDTTDDEDTESDDESEVSDDETSDDEEDDPLEFDLSSHASELVTVKVNGEETQVPLSEVVNGYMRQADYTRKTQNIAEIQKLADWGKQMRDALIEDPEGLINGLAQAMNVEITPPAPDDTYQTDDPELAPFADKLRKLDDENKQLRSWIESQQKQTIENQVRAELQAAQAKYPDLDPHVVLPLAANKQLGIEEAYLLNEGLNGRSTKKEESDKVKKVADKTLAKRKLAKTVSQGTKRNAPVTPTDSKGDSFADMLLYDISKASK